ncbi:MAG TPA: hypothetical protein VMI52_03530 [Acetobacteraceae bacterium]|nr:hypothetical protein [Acetobacteraceae bacterium]
MTFRIPDTEASAPSGLNATAGVISALRNASAETGTSFNVLLASASMESGLRPDARSASSSAKGLFQFVEQSWLQAVHDYGANHGLSAEAAAIVRRSGQLTVEDPSLRQHILDLRNDAKLAASMAGNTLQAVADKLTGVLGRAPDAAETYLGHFLGQGGAAQMLQTAQTAPGKAAADILPAAAHANPAMFYAADGTPYTATQFINHIRAKVDRAFAELGLPVPQGGMSFGKTGSAQADSLDSGATGWGTNRPRQATSTQEQLALASLAEVFTRLDRNLAHASDSRMRRGGHGTPLPNGVLSAMEERLTSPSQSRSAYQAAGQNT